MRHSRIMPVNSRALSYVLQHPGAFMLQTLKGFRANQGLLLAGAVAYYTLLSVVPLLILIVIALSHVIDQAELMSTLGRYLEWLVPGQSKAIVAELATFVEHRQVIGTVLLVTMIFFSSLAFTVLENAMSVIFFHRLALRRRRFVVSALLPYLLHPPARDRIPRDNPGLGQSASDRRGAHRVPRTHVVAGRRVGRAALPAGTRGRNLHPHVDLSRHAGRAVAVAPRAGGRHYGGAAVGGHAPRARCGTSRDSRR